MPGPGTLSALVEALSEGAQNLGSIALAVGVEGSLLVSVDQGRQALPLVVAEAIARVLETDRGTVVSAVPMVIDSTAREHYAVRPPVYLSGKTLVSSTALSLVSQPAPSAAPRR
jgi:hypothetical protein